MSEQILTSKEQEALKVLIYFYLKIDRPQSAYRGAKAMHALYPKDPWAKGMLAICANALEKFDEVISLTDDLEFFLMDKNMHRSLLLVRMRAFNKLGQSLEVDKLLAVLNKE